MGSDGETWKELCRQLNADSVVLRQKLGHGREEFCEAMGGRLPDGFVEILVHRTTSQECSAPSTLSTVGMGDCRLGLETITPKCRSRVLGLCGRLCSKSSSVARPQGLITSVQCPSVLSWLTLLCNIAWTSVTVPLDR